ASDDDDWDFTSRTSDGESLQTHLLWQLNLLPGLSDTDKLIAVTLVDALNEQGYLEESIDDLVAAFDPALEIEADEVEAVLHRLQHLEPAGVFARDLRECLLLQLRQLPADTPWLEQAKRLTGDYLDLLAGRDYAQLMRR